MRMMLRAITAMAVLIISNTISFGTPGPDSLILLTPDEAVYSSPFEEEVIKEILDGKSGDYFSLFLCYDSTLTRQDAETYRQRFNAMIREYHSPYYEKMNEKKRIARIYEGIHETLLRKYTPQAPFSSVFKNGEFHCVSSSMLYALSFGELGVPYEIRIIPDHVYLVAYPSTHYITVETTDPLHGTITYDQAFKAGYVEYLAESKLITREELTRKGTDAVFEENFRESESITLKDLAAAQYRNQALEDYENERYKSASRNQEKAFLLAPDTVNSYLLFLSWLMYYTELDKGGPECAGQLGKLTRFLNKGISVDELTGEFAQIIQKQLLYEGNGELLDSSYQIVMSYVKDTTLGNEFSFLYHYERGRILLSQLEYEAAMPHVKRAFELKPKSVDAKNNLLRSVVIVLTQKTPPERLELIEGIVTEIPALMDDNLFAQLRLSMYLMMIDQSYFDHDAAGGEKYMKEFEALYPERNNKFHLLEKDIGQAYGTASMYYFRRGQTGRTREILEKGLQYAPNDFDLRNRLNSLK